MDPRSLAQAFRCARRVAGAGAWGWGGGEENLKCSCADHVEVYNEKEKMIWGLGVRFEKTAWEGVSRVQARGHEWH